MAGKTVADSVSVKNIHQRICQAMQQMEPVSKAKENTFHHYKYASYDALVAAVKPVFVQQGIVLIVDDQAIACREIEGDKGKKQLLTELQCLVTFANSDNPKDVITVKVNGHGIDSNDFGPSKARTQCVKEALKKVLMLEVEETSNSGDRGAPAGHKATQGKGRQTAAVAAYDAEAAYLQFLHDNWRAIQNTSRVSIEDVTVLVPLWIEFVGNDLSEAKYRSLLEDKGKTINKFSMMVKERLGEKGK